MKTMNITKMSTVEIINKIAKLTNVSKIELQTLTRDELKIALTNMMANTDKIEAVTSFDDVLYFVYGDDGADEDVIDAIADYEESYEGKVDDELYATLTDDEDIVTDGQIDESKLMFELHPEEKTVGRPSTFNDKKLRKAFRHHARKIATKLGKCWEKQGEDYIVDGELISWVEYVANHSA